MAEYFPFYDSFKTAVSKLPDAERLRMYDIITDYGNLGIEPEFEECEWILSALFSVIKPNIDSAKMNQKNGVKGGKGNKKSPLSEKENPPLGSFKPPFEDCETPLSDFPKHKGNSNSNSEGNSKGEGDNKGATCNRRFTPPTREEVHAYVQEHGFDVDVERFVDYYTANGWMVGKSHMKDWKAAVRNWNRQNTNDGKGAKQDGKGKPQFGICL